MGLTGLRALVLETNRAVFGVPATVTRPAPDTTPIATSVIWVSPGLSRPFAEAYPLDHRLQRRQAERMLVILLEDVLTVPKGTRVDAPERSGGPVRPWVVDDTEYIDADHVRAVVVPGEA